MTEEKQGFQGFLCGLFKCDASEPPPQCPVLQCAYGTSRENGTDGPDAVTRCVLDTAIQAEKMNEVLVRRVGELSEEYIQTYKKYFSAYGSYQVLNRKDSICQGLTTRECALVPGCARVPAFQAVGAESVSRCGSAEYAEFVEKANIVVPKPAPGLEDLAVRLTDWGGRVLDDTTPETQKASAQHVYGFCSATVAALPERDVHPACSMTECPRFTELQPLCEDPNATKEQIQAEMDALQVHFY